jgi:hypothetical protein
MFPKISIKQYKKAENTGKMYKTTYVPGIFVFLSFATLHIQSITTGCLKKNEANATYEEKIEEQSRKKFPENI